MLLQKKRLPNWDAGYLANKSSIQRTKKSKKRKEIFKNVGQ